MSKGDAHPVELALFEPLPAELDLGAPFVLSVAVTTTSGCNLSGAAFEVMQGGVVIASSRLPEITRFDADSNDYDPRNGPIDKRDHARIALQAPPALGAFEWRLALPEQEIDGVAHARATLDFAFTTGEHRTSLAAWDVPSPIITGETFTVKVGAKCSACCALTGRTIELRDAQGAVVGVGELGDAPWPGTEGLYWAELRATSSAATGLQNCSVAFSAGDLALPHQGAAAALSYVAVEPGRHRVCVTIVACETGEPIAQAQVRLGYHRGESDAEGVARFTAPPGEQRLFVWKAGFEAPEQTIDVSCDLELTVEAQALPEEDPYARWQG